MRQANLALKFALELAAFAAFGWWGATAADDALAVVLAIACPLAGVVLWGTLAAPRSPRRLPLAVRAPFELGVFALAALAYAGAGSGVAAVAFACVAAANAALLTAWRQWEA
jgi:hypothetical protein